MASPQALFSATAMLFAVTVGLGNPARPHTRRPSHDLDRMPDAQLHRDLMAELNEMFKHGSPTQNVAACTLADEAIEALGDDGDAADDDAFDDEIDLSDLEAEMEEADLELDEEIDAAVGCHRPSDAGSYGQAEPGVHVLGDSAEAPPPRRTGANQVEARIFRDIRAKSR
jgi:hypothetical protein